jgi:hypothetical protein
MKKINSVSLFIILILVNFSCHEETIEVEPSVDILFGDVTVLGIPQGLKSVENENVRYMTSTFNRYVSHIKHLQQDFIPDGKEIKLDSNFTAIARIPPQSHNSLETLYWMYESYENPSKATINGGHFKDTIYFEFFEQEFWNIPMAWIQTSYAWQLNKGKIGSLDFRDWWSETYYTFNWKRSSSKVEIEVSHKEYDYGHSVFRMVFNADHSGYIERTDYCLAYTKAIWDTNGFGNWHHVDCSGNKENGSY